MNRDRKIQANKRIGIDARMYHYGYGIGRYIQQLIAALEKVGDDNQYYIFLEKKMWDLYQPTNAAFHKVQANFPWYSLQEQMRLPLLVKKYHIDLMHYPHFNVPLISPAPFIVTIHDLTMFTSPHSARIAASTRSRLRYEIMYAAYRFIIRSAVARARHIITVSQTAKKDLVNYLHIPPDRITVVYNGNTRHEIKPIRPADIQDSFYLCVGSSYPHKNVTLVIDAWNELVRQGFRVPLVLCGQEDIFRDRIVAYIRDRGLTGSITHLGMVSEAELSWLYGHAKGLIVPSLQEGFGLPSAEALRYNLPSLTSRLPVFEEILGDCALYFDPHDVHDLTRVILRYDADAHLREQLRTACHARESRYNWDNAAKQTNALYQKFFVP